MTITQAPPPIQLALLDCTILLVSRSDQQATLAAHLLRRGFHRLLFASDPGAALWLALSEQPDLVLIDLSGQAFDGAQLCETLRKKTHRNELPILAILDMPDSDGIIRLLAAGAADVLVKPLPELGLLGRILVQLERHLLIRDLQTYHQRTATELATAQDMQRALLPDELTLQRIKEDYDIDVAATFKPSRELGGDLWGAWAIDQNRIGVFTCDVSGHGTIAAINTFRLHTLTARSDFDRSDPGRFLTNLNDHLAGLLTTGQFVTMFYGVIDTRQDCIIYATAGCPEPVLALPGCLPEGLDGSGLPLGIAAGILYPTQRAPFVPGARLVLLSDAFAEATLGDGSLVGEQEARAMVTTALKHPTAATIIDSLTQHIVERVSQQLEDDLTLVCLERPLSQDDQPRTPALPAIAGRLLSVTQTTQSRDLVQKSGAALALAVDEALGLTSANKLLSEFRYDIAIVEVSIESDEWPELFRSIASANRRTRLILIGAHVELGKLLAVSLGVTPSATLKTVADVSALHVAVASALANDDLILNNGIPTSMTEVGLGRAIKAGEIIFDFQRQISLTSRNIIGAETLARWKSPDYGVVSATVLMSLAAHRSVAPLFADVTLKSALAACASWRKSMAWVSVAVNLSAAALADPGLIPLVRSHLRANRLPADALTIEVGETDATRSMATLEALRQMGVNITLDGFGHGGTSLQTLGKLPISTLKIGREIFQGCADDPDALRLLQAISGVARALDLKVAAVGIEVPAEEQMLRDVGCDIAQGWLYGPAAPATGVFA